MLKTTSRIYSIIPTVCFYCGLALLLSGCAILQGRTVGEDNRLALHSESVQKGTFIQSGHAIHYSYQLRDNNLKIEGTIDGKEFRWLRVQLLLLDDSGHVRERENIFTSNYRQPSSFKMQHSFARETAVADVITGISFDVFAEYRSSRD